MSQFANITFSANIIMVRITRMSKSSLLFSEVDECESNPCRFGGQCVNGLGQYLCLCTDRYSGTNCERRKQILTYMNFFLNIFSLLSFFINLC